MGWQNAFAVLFQAGNTVVINANGEFIYNGVPAKGNLLASITSSSGFDEYENPYEAGIFTYGADNSGAGLLVVNDAAVIDLIGGGLAHETQNALIFSESINPGDANEIGTLILSSGKESGGDDAALQLFSESADGTIPAEAIIEFGGVVFATVTKTGLVLPGDVATPTAVPGSVCVFGTESGSLAVVDGVDSEPYATQRRSLSVGSGGVDIPGTSYVSVLSSAVGTRAYRISGVAYIVTSEADTTPAIQFTGPATSSGEFAVLTTRATVVNSSFAVAPNTTGTAFAEIVTSGQTWLCWFDGIVTFSASGTFHLQFAATAGSFTIAESSYIDIMPV